MRIAVCDDEKICREGIERCVRVFALKEDIEVEIRCFEDGYGLLDAGYKDYDLIFLDIEMEGINGIKIKNRLRMEHLKTRILFVTSHSENMPKAFGENVIGFVEKPINPDEIDRYLHYVKECIGKDKVYQIKNGESMVLVRASEIMYIKANGKYTEIYSNTNRFFIEKSISEWEKELEKSLFVRVHRGWILNMKYIKNFGSTIMMEDGKSIPVARPRKKEIKDIYLCYIKNKAYGM